MKTCLIIFAAISIFASCNSDQKETTTKEVVGAPDSNLYKNNTMADTGQFAPAPVVPPATTVEKRTETVKTSKPKATKPVVKTGGSTVTPAPVTKAGTKTDTASSPAPVTATTTPAPAVTPEKKGWSNAAKGATIGGVGGAIGGAILSKKKGKGAIIGGAIGAAGGYILGRKKDKNQQAQDTIK